MKYRNNIISWTTLILSLVVVTVILMGLNIIPNDFWWHSETGRYIFENGKLPETVIGSWYAEQNNLPWKAHEWLYDFVVYFVTRGSVDIAVPLHFIVLLATIIIMLVPKIDEKTLGFNSVIAMSACAIMTSTFALRPQTVQLLLLVVFLFILDKAMDSDNGRAVYWTIPVTILWVNMHGGSSNLSYLLVLMALVLGGVKVNLGKIAQPRKSLKWFRNMAIAFGLNVGAILINPYGIEMIVYPYANMADKAMLSRIKEWFPLDIGNPGNLITVGVLVCYGIYVFVSTKKKVRPFDLAIFLAFTYLAFKSIRFIPYIAIALIMFVLPYGKEAVATKSLIDRYEENKASKPSVGIKTYAMNGLVLAVCLTGLAVCNRTIVYEQLDSDFEATVRELQSQEDSRMYTTYNITPDLLGCGLKTFTDTRYEPFKGDLIDDTWELIQYNPPLDKQFEQIESIIEKYDFNQFILKEADSLYAYMQAHEDEYEQLGSTTLNEEKFYIYARK